MAVPDIHTIPTPYSNQYQSYMQTVKDKLLVLSEDYENGTAVLFSLDLKSFRWTRMASVSLKSNKRPTSLSSLGPPARGNPTISLTKGGHLLIIGGHNRNESRYPGQLLNLKYTPAAKKIQPFASV